MSTNGLIRETLKMIAEEGGKSTSVEKGKHIKIRFLTPQGIRMIVLSNSPTNAEHALRNSRRLVKKLMADTSKNWWKG